MNPIFLSIAIPLAVIGIAACSTETQSGCGCMSVALEISARGTNGSEITLDSIKYKYGNAQTETIKKDTAGSIDGFIGYDVGEYKVWAYYGSVISDTVVTNVEMSGPDDCRLPSTKKIEFKFEDGSYQGKTLSEIGSCGE
mgnify:CR=1 FL=1